MLLDKKSETYKLLSEKLYERCKKLQLENERCVMRVNCMKKLTRQRARDVELIKRRLDKHQDNWRSVPMVAPHPKRKTEQKRGPKPKNKQPTENEDGTQPKEKKVRKKRTKKNVQNVVQQQQQPVQQLDGSITTELQQFQTAAPQIQQPT